MDQYRGRYNTKAMWALIVLGVGCSSLLYYEPALIGTSNVAGIIGVVVGLYICSHPAAHVVDLLFFRRSGRPQFPSKWAAVWWLIVNMLVLLIGWMVIFLGTTRLVSRGD